MNDQSYLWAGDEESFWTFMKVTGLVPEAQVKSRDPFTPPPLIDVTDGVAVMQISGSLIPGTAGWMRMYGIMGYQDIQDGLQMAVEDRSVKSILALYSTAGGAVEGADETSEMIAAVSKVKPVVSFASGNMLSAGMWLGSAGKRRLAGRTSLVGSIGVIVTHFDRTEQLKQMGIKATVFRSGKWKGLGNPAEPLSKEAENTIQGVVDDINDIFEARISANLRIDVKTVHDKMGQGRQFLGAKAFEIGLVDGISTVSQAFQVAQTLGRG